MFVRRNYQTRRPLKAKIAGGAPVTDADGLQALIAEQSAFNRPGRAQVSGGPRSFKMRVKFNSMNIRLSSGT
jgi:hypothetical protein